MVILDWGTGNSISFQTLNAPSNSSQTRTTRLFSTLLKVQRQPMAFEPYTYLVSKAKVRILLKLLNSILSIDCCCMLLVSINTSHLFSLFAITSDVSSLLTPFKKYYSLFLATKWRCLGCTSPQLKKAGHVSTSFKFLMLANRQQFLISAIVAKCSLQRGCSLGYYWRLIPIMRSSSAIELSNSSLLFIITAKHYRSYTEYL